MTLQPQPAFAWLRLELETPAADVDMVIGNLFGRGRDAAAEIISEFRTDSGGNAVVDFKIGKPSLPWVCTRT